VCQCRRSSKHIAVVQRATEVGQHQTDTQHETEVTHTVDQECLQVGKMAVGRLNQKPISR
jgi:hypothetical protein